MYVCMYVYIHTRTYTHTKIVYSVYLELVRTDFNWEDDS